MLFANYKTIVLKKFIYSRCLGSEILMKYKGQVIRTTFDYLGKYGEGHG
jgi:hypothetical protein